MKSENQTKTRSQEDFTSCRQVNDLFEVMQQPSAPSGELC